MLEKSIQKDDGESPQSSEDDPSLEQEDEGYLNPDDFPDSGFEIPEIPESMYIGSEEYNKIIDEYNKLPVDEFTLVLPYINEKDEGAPDEAEDDIPAELELWEQNLNYLKTLASPTETVKSENLDWTDMNQKKLTEKLIWIYS